MGNIKTYINLLKSNRNLVLTGAPGTGKTYLAKRIAAAMRARTEFVQFHPSYTYSDFVEGLRPIDNGKGEIGFERKDGIFKSFCKEALRIYKNPSTILSIPQKTLLDYYEELADNIKKKKVTNITTLHDKIIPICVNDNGIICHRNKTYKMSYKSVENFSKKYPDIESLKSREKSQSRHSALAAILNMLYCMKDEDIAREAELNAIQNNTDYELEENEVFFKNESKPFIFIIDELNRGELSKIFGELFYAIDPEYRGKIGKVKTQYQNLVDKQDEFSKGFYVPENVYIIATMNDIDRSVESMDFALRRRFAWKEIKPEDRLGMLTKNLDMEICETAIKVMSALNQAISDTRGLGSAYQIGPAYFLKLSNKHYDGDFTALWDMHIEIILRDYFRGHHNVDEKIEVLKKVYFDTLNGKI